MDVEEDGSGTKVAGTTMPKINKRPKGQLRKKRVDSDEDGAAVAGAGACDEQQSSPRRELRSLACRRGRAPVGTDR